MPCAATHQIVNFTATAAFLASRPAEDQCGFAHPLLGGTATALLGSLPDIVEPAIHPHHRQFFHSLTFAGALGYGVYKAYEWEPKTQTEECLRIAALVFGAAYLMHLAADFTTSRSLPLIGH